MCVIYFLFIILTFFHFIQRIEESVTDRINDVPHRVRQYTFVVDYCQNLDLPHLGAEQAFDLD